MQFMITYELTPATRDVGQARFKETGGLPPEGVEMQGRWHNLAGHRGFVLAETDDAVALATWMQDWTDVLTFEVNAVANDEQMIEVLGA